MQASTLTMSSVFNSGSSFFSRSKSSPNIPELAKVKTKISKVAENNDNLPRSASFTFIPNANVKARHDPGATPDTEITERGQNHKEEREGRRQKQSSKDERPHLESVGRRKSLTARPKSWIQRVRGSPERAEVVEADNTPGGAQSGPYPSKSVKDDRRKSVSGSFASFARKSWMASSRSPSPSRTSSNSGSRKPSVDRASSRTTLDEGEVEVLQSPPSLSKDRSGSPSRSVMSRRSTLQKIKERPQSVLLNFTNITSANSSTSSIPSSVENKSTPRTSTDKIPPVPKTFSTEKLLMGLDGQRRKDELWSAFRSLDNDFSKFQSKSWTLKTNIVRSSLLPFLKNHADHPSNDGLRPEDLERRITVLNKWWNGLLEVLDGRQNQVVNGVDRPVLLEACYCIMVRPEWRVSPHSFAPVSKRASRSPGRYPLSGKKSSTSLRSDGSQFLADSIYHNTKTLFTQNLLTQVSYAVDKMSLRHAPASLVTFCGKALAYAFFFVPGIANMLVRVWDLSGEVLQQVADEFGLPRRRNQQDIESVAATFPEHLRYLAWTSAKAMSTLLHQKANLPIMVTKVNWFGPWQARWCGRDSDLFFVFVKHYFILAEQFLDTNLTLLIKCRAPGFLLVQAQLLTVLDGTIKRTVSTAPLPITFDDVLSGVDVTAAALPLPSSNSSRPMAENRLIMLLRDFLSEQSSEFLNARRTFASILSKILQASARKTSIYNHNACLVLCDFMEEALVIFVRFLQKNPDEPDPIDWCFWLEVCQMILQSQNSISEIRLFSFIFGLWNLITGDLARKEVVTLKWLLAEDTFLRFFCHWCPMVRAYYMRLLCWRLCRDDGEASDLDTKIFATLSMRLKLVYSHYLFLKQDASDRQTLPPSTLPSHPAPGRRLLIIRNDNQAPSANIFLGFDGIIPSSQPPPTSNIQFKRHSIHGSQNLLDNPPVNTESQTPKDGKKRWSIMGKSLPQFDLSSPSASPNTTPSSSPPKSLDDARREVADARSMRSTPLPLSSSAFTDKSLGYQTYFFKFSLEWTQQFERNGKRANYDRKIVSPRLPSPAQACISARVPSTALETLPRDPGVCSEGVKYAGRALAEWAIIVGECNSFVERRRMEGIPSLKLVEVPVLGVEGFRKFNG